MKTPEQILAKLSREAVYALARPEPPSYWPLIVEMTKADLVKIDRDGYHWSKRGQRVRNWLLGVNQSVV